jgi:diguanylate cyclase (GGDEF)-like protein
MKAVVMAVWRRYLLVGIVASAICVALPRGIPRDVIYCLIGFSSAVAILAGVRMNRPAHPGAWYFFGAATATWALADGLYGWYEHVALVAPFPSIADVLYLAVYPLFAAGLLMLGRSRRAKQRAHRPAIVDETAILTIGLGLLAWVFLIEPTWISYDEPLINRLVGVAYPFCDVLLFAMLMRLSTSAGVRSPSFLLVSGSVGAMLVADGVFLAGALVPAIAARSSLLDFGWLLSYVLWGAAALHPSMRELSSPPPQPILRFSSLRLALLATAVAIGPAILSGELIVGRPLDIVPILIAGGATLVLVIARVGRMMRLLDSQAERLRELADTDYVTGLPTCRCFNDRLTEFLDDPRGQVAAFLLIDVERFAEIHDTLGHQTGDAILHAVGIRLREQAAGNAYVARMGGNSFGVLDPTISSGEEAGLAAERIRQALERPLELPDLSVSVEVTVGALLLPEDGAQPGLALLRADVALSVARARAEHTARYGKEMESGDGLAAVVIGELAEALKHGELIVHYQPQVEILSQRVTGVEALVRWQHPRHGLLEPDTFIPAAEQTGLIGPLTMHVLDSALRQCATWQREGLNLTVAVNLSVRNLLDPGLVDDVCAALERHGLDARSLELELTESAAMVNPRHSKQVLTALADLGIELSIDDYGTGHSSLSYLQQLPVGRLKIDGSFVTRMLVDEASAAIVDSTIKLAQVLRLDVVAEGVEDDATLRRLGDLRCGAAQGFNLGPPVVATLVPGLIARIEERLPAVLGTPALSRARPVR